MSVVDVAPEVAAALAAGEPVVALESTVIAHGLPWPDNLAVARAMEAAVRAAGAVPATIAVLDGRVRVGLDAAELESGTAMRLFRRHPAPNVVFGKQADMGIELLAQVAIGISAEEASEQAIPGAT